MNIQNSFLVKPAVNRSKLSNCNFHNFFWLFEGMLLKSISDWNYRRRNSHTSADISFNNLCVASKKETINSPINRFKVCTVKMPASLSKHLVLYLIHYFKKHFKPCFFILKAFKTFCSTNSNLCILHDSSLKVSCKRIR